MQPIPKVGQIWFDPLELNPEKKYLFITKIISDKKTSENNKFRFYHIGDDRCMEFAGFVTALRLHCKLVSG